MAAEDLFFLLTRNYAENGAVKLVGDRYNLRSRQRYALQRIVVPGDIIREIRSCQLSEHDIKGKHIAVDGFNLLILGEVLCSDGFIFQCFDGTYRDIASIHGSYRRVEETPDAIISIGKVIEKYVPSSVIWYLDSPVSNSGRLKGRLEEIAAYMGWVWDVQLVHDADQVLISAKDAVVLSSDRHVLQQCSQWFNFSSAFIREYGGSMKHLITLKDLGVNEPDSTMG